ncbi:MAG: diguanylate cyclase [Pseudomonadota bacterium]|nr:diguanylate cyclase [Pseudomonadota bacterium]
MHFPSVLEICSMEVLTISNQCTLKEALDKMIVASHRNVVVLGGHFPHILRAQDILNFNLQKVPVNQQLSGLELKPLPMAKDTENVLDSVRFLKQEIEYIGVEDDAGELRGLLTHTDIVNSIEPEVLMENYSISDVLNQHRQDLWVNQAELTEAVIAQMVLHDTDCVIALNDSGGLEGVFTTKDVMRLYESDADLQLALSNYMSFPVQTICSDASVKEALRFVKTKHFKRVVVVDENERLQGMILQSELIALSYSKWALIMRQFQSELQELNSLLEQKSKHYEDLAGQDPLTGLYNRYKFTEIFTTEFLTMQRRENSMALLMLDLDHFKEVNDSYGHNVGDEVLIALSKMLLSVQRQTDVVCRWGGEEFMVLLPSANREQACLIAENLRERVKALNVLEGLSLSASFGVTLVEGNDTLEGLVGRADSALYEAKKSGRDCVMSL